MIVATWTYLGRQYRLVDVRGACVLEVKELDAAGGDRWVTASPTPDYNMPEYTQAVLRAGIRELARQHRDRDAVSAGGLPDNYREG